MSADLRRITLESFDPLPRGEVFDAAAALAASLRTTSTARVSCAWAVASHFGRVPMLDDWHIAFGTTVHSETIRGFAPFLHARVRDSMPREVLRLGEILGRFSPEEVAMAARYSIALAEGRPLDWPQAGMLLESMGAALGAA